MPLSNKQMEYLALAWQCFETEPKIDYDKFAQVANLASAHSARELLRVTKKKLKEEYGALSGASNGTPKTPKTPASGAGRKRGRKALVEMEGDDEEEVGCEGSPSKKSVKGNGEGSATKRVKGKENGEGVKKEVEAEGGDREDEMFH